jgi:hypothetical protein
MSIAGHDSRAMLSRYSHVRMEAKRRALDGIASRQSAADEKRKAEAERREQAAQVSQSALIQQTSGNTHEIVLPQGRHSFDATATDHRSSGGANQGPTTDCLPGSKRPASCDPREPTPHL